MIEFTSEEWFTITGRGRCALIDFDQLGDNFIRPGDQVMIDGAEYTIEEINYVDSNVAGPNPKSQFGILVRDAP